MYANALKAVQAKKGSYEELEKKRDAAKAELEDFSAAARADIQRTLDNRRKEFLSVIEAYAKVNAEYSVKTSQQWKAAATASLEGGPASVPDLKGKVPEQLPAQKTQEDYHINDDDDEKPMLTSSNNGTETSPYAADEE